MATTGAEFYKIYQQRGGMSYGGYLDTAKANRLFKESLFESIEVVYRTLDNQRDYDKLNKLIRSNVAVTPVNNEVNLYSLTAPSLAPDYLHLLNLAANYEIQQPLIQAEGFSNASPIVFDTGWYTQLREGMQIKIAGVLGNITANGTWFLKAAGKNKFSLWMDENFTTASAGSGAYTSGGTVYFLHRSQCRQQIAQRKGAVLEAPSADYPLFGLEDGVLRIYPLSPACTSISVDYLTKATVLIDALDTTIDLELTYPYLFLTETVLNMALKFAGEQFRDNELRNESGQELKITT